jgi:hypothetical protein
MGLIFITKFVLICVEPFAHWDKYPATAFSNYDIIILPASQGFRFGHIGIMKRA